MCYTVVGNYSGGYRIAHKGRQPQSELRQSIITARKRSLGQGNVFRSVCQSFCPRRGGLPQGEGIPPGGICIQGVCLRGPVSRGVFPPQMGYYGIQLTVGGAHPAGMHSCLTIFLQQNCMILKESGPRKFTAIVKVNNFYYDKNIKLYLNGKRAV